jgi:ADP-ribose pyrophosphatase
MPYRLVEKQVIYNGKKVRVEVHHFEDPDDVTKRAHREVCVHPGAVVVLALLNDVADRGREKVLLIRNRRHAVGRTLVELPAGTLEKNEDPINCAGRELLEETGYLAGRLKSIGSFYSSPGILTETMYAYAAYDLEPQLQALEEGEEIELMPVPLDEAIDMIRTGDIQDAKTIAALLMFERFHRGR